MKCNTELLNLSLRVGEYCRWNDFMIDFWECGVSVNNDGVIRIWKTVTMSTLERIMPVINKWLELQKQGCFKELRK